MTDKSKMITIAILSIVIILLIGVIVMSTCDWKSYFTFLESKSCCSKGHAGCMCRNPKYFPFVGQQSDRTSKVDRLTGILVDARCYALTRNNYTNSHSFPPSKEKVAKGCATACAKSGVPVALLLGSLPPGPDNKAIILLHPSPNLAEYMEKQTRVSGYFMKDMNSIFTTCVEVRDKDGEWKDIEFTTPMIKMASSLTPKIENLSMEPSFTKDIRKLFRDSDVETMKTMGLDLSDYEDVKKNADKIYSRVSEGSMPCDGAWSQDNIELFKRWIDSGKGK